ncbi:hypothetical protein GCM10009559_05820 [Pseudonocardia zijingensis]|uniref:Uncharacterized protein n=1 Tax=Pseudonocardia zijingensis TaxID=153376 RepID=A0ABP3ZLG9_9PSEU
MRVAPAARVSHGIRSSPSGSGQRREERRMLPRPEGPHDAAVGPLPGQAAAAEPYDLTAGRTRVLVPIRRLLVR